MWKENIVEIHPSLTKEQEERVYKNIANMLIEIYMKYKDKWLKKYRTSLRRWYKMIEVLIIMMMCVAKIVLQSIPSLLIAVFGHAILYQTTGISVYNIIYKKMMKEVK